MTVTRIVSTVSRRFPDFPVGLVNQPGQGLPDQAAIIGKLKTYGYNTAGVTDAGVYKNLIQGFSTAFPSRRLTGHSG